MNLSNKICKNQTAFFCPQPISRLHRLSWTSSNCRAECEDRRVVAANKRSQDVRRHGQLRRQSERHCFSCLARRRRSERPSTSTVARQPVVVSSSNFHLLLRGLPQHTTYETMAMVGGVSETHNDIVLTALQCRPSVRDALQDGEVNVRVHAALCSSLSETKFGFYRSFSSTRTTSM